MTLRRTSWMRLGVLALLACGMLLLSGCGAFEGPQNTFSAQGEVAEKQKNLFLLAMWPALAIMILVEAACVYVVIRYRRRRDDDALPRQVHGNTALELGWTLAPVVLLAFIAVPTLAAIIDLGNTPKGAYPVKVIGRQWVWEFQYPELKDANGQPVSTFREAHIPAGRAIDFQIESIDVNHSFWVPKLGGKTDAIPGRTNRMWLKSDGTGAFEGQCAEFCGLQHADMKLRIVADNEQDFLRWARDQGAVNPSVSGQ